MANWEDLKGFIRANWEMTEVSPRAVELIFETNGGRSQLVFVSSIEDANGEWWASIDSPIGREDSVDIFRALRLVEEVTCGGLAHLLLRGQDLIAIRHSVPLAHLDVSEFVEPLLMVTAAADDFERMLTGGDAL